MKKAISFILCIIALASANHILINAYPYRTDSCRLAMGNTVTFHNGIIFYLLEGGSYNGPGWPIYLGIENNSYVSLGYKDTSNSDTNWATSNLMPVNLTPLVYFTQYDSTKCQVIAIGGMIMYQNSCGTGFFPSSDHRIWYAKVKDSSNMKFQIDTIRVTSGYCPSNGLENISILFEIDSLGNGRFTNGPTKLRMNSINNEHKNSTRSMYVDLRGKLHKKDMLNKFRSVVKKEYLFLR